MTLVAFPNSLVNLSAQQNVLDTIAGAVTSGPTSVNLYGGPGW